MPTWSTIGVWSSFPSKTWLTDVDHATKGLNNTHSPWKHEQGYSIWFWFIFNICQGIHVCLINLHWTYWHWSVRTEPAIPLYKQVHTSYKQGTHHSIQAPACLYSYKLQQNSIPNTPLSFSIDHKSSNYNNSSDSQVPPAFLNTCNRLSSNRCALYLWLYLRWARFYGVHLSPSPLTKSLILQLMAQHMSGAVAI